MNHFTELSPTDPAVAGENIRNRYYPPSAARFALAECHRLIAVLCGGSLHVLNHACDTLRIPRALAVQLQSTAVPEPRRDAKPLDFEFIQLMGGTITENTARFESSHARRPWYALTITREECCTVAVLHGLHNREPAKIEIPAPRSRAELVDLLEGLKLACLDKRREWRVAV